MKIIAYPEPLKLLVHGKFAYNNVIFESKKTHKNLQGRGAKYILVT